MTGRRTIEAANAEIAFTNFLMSIVLIVFAIAVLLYMLSKGHFNNHSSDDLPLLAIPGVLMLVALIYLGNSILNWLRVSKSGKSFMDIEEAVYGKVVRGQIRTERNLEPKGDYTLHIECIERLRFRDRPGKSRERTFVRWQRTQTVAAEGIRSTAGIPVHIPLEAVAWPEVPYTAERLGSHWELTVRAPLPGLNYSAIFGVTLQEQSDV